MKWSFKKGVNSSDRSAKQNRSLFLLSSLFVTVLIFVTLLSQAPPMQASDVMGREAALSSEDNEHYLAYLPVIMKPPFLVADFYSCDSTNNLGGNMGAAYVSPSDLVVESYEEVHEPPGGCEAHIEYHIKDWGSFWLQLEHADLSEYSLLIFDIMGDASVGVPAQMKIEIKRDCQKVEGSKKCTEIDFLYFADTTEEWQRKVNIELSDFEPVEWPGYSGIQDWLDIEELVFTFEANSSGQDGAIYLDNIQFGN